MKKLLSLGLIVTFSLASWGVVLSQTMHVCPGSGEKCVAEIEFKGDKVKVTSEKTKGKGTVVVE